MSVTVVSELKDLIKQNWTKKVVFANIGRPEMKGVYVTRRLLPHVASIGRPISQSFAGTGDSTSEIRSDYRHIMAGK